MILKPKFMFIEKIAELAAVSIKKYHLQDFKDYERVPAEKLDILEKKIIAILAEGSQSLKLFKRLIEILVLLYGNNEGIKECCISWANKFFREPRLPFEDYLAT